MVDVTIQCQFNVSAKNVMDYTNVNEFSGGYQAPASQDSCNYDTDGSPKRHYPSGYDSYNCGYSNSDCTHMSVSGNSDCAFGKTYLDDSGYGSPPSGLAQQQRFTPSVQTVPDTFLGICDMKNGISDDFVDYSAYAPCDSVNRTYPSQPRQRQQQPSPVTIETHGVSTDQMKLAMHEKDILQRIFSLRAADVDGVDSVETYYKAQTTAIDHERHSVLGQMTYDKSSQYVQKYYNRKLMSLLVSVEEKLVTLENNKSKNSGGKSRKSAQRSRLLPKHAVTLMETWYMENLENPYPPRETTVIMATEGGVTVEQIRKWFANKRNRSRNDKLKCGDSHGEG